MESTILQIVAFEVCVLSTQLLFNVLSLVSAFRFAMKSMTTFSEFYSLIVSAHSTHDV